MSMDATERAMSALDVTTDDDFAANVINSVFDVFVMPELQRRNLTLGRAEIRKVVVELSPDRRHPRVWINDKAEVVAHVRATRDIKSGEAVSDQDFDEVHAVVPQRIGPNSGYVCFAIIKGKQYLNFDFRYNKLRVATLLKKAQEFLEVSRQCASERPAVTCDLAFSAAELSVQAQMLLMQQHSTSHSVRRSWLENWVEHNNAPSEHAVALRTLHRYRLAARYEHELVEIDPEELNRLLLVVEHMISYAASQCE